MEILCYTRKPKEDPIYANRLAYSMHLAYLKADGYYEAFHHNEGLLYAKATQNSDGTLNPKSIKKPWLFAGKNSYFAVAIRTEADGLDDEESKGSILVWETKDLVHYNEMGLLLLQKDTWIRDIRCRYDEVENVSVLSWENAEGEWYDGKLYDFSQVTDVKRIAYPDDLKMNQDEISNIEGIIYRNHISVPDEIGEYLIKKLTVPTCVGVEIPESICVRSVEELKNVRLNMHYSDGTSVNRKVDWHTDTIDLNQKGSKSVVGTVLQETFVFPVALNRADPCAMYRYGNYYFIATNDADGNKSMYIRKSETLKGLEAAEEILLLDTKRYEDIKGLLWAPEFHVIGDDLYIFHAATESEFFWEESRVMKLKKGGDPICAEDWSRPQLVVKKDGSPLCEAGKVISLDMTTFEYLGKQYAIWSQRQFLPIDQGAWLYIAEINPDEPWRLVSDPVLLALPEYGWENNHTFVVEGPFLLRNDSSLMITYSGAAVDSTYAVGLLSLKNGSDILNPDNWVKNNYPLLTSRSVDGEFGPGHNSYLVDENNITWNFYHARPGVKGPRSSGIRRVHFDTDGEPMLDVVYESDLPEEFRNVKINILTDC